MRCWWTWTSTCIRTEIWQIVFVAPFSIRWLLSAVPFVLIAARLRDYDATCQLRASHAELEFRKHKDSRTRAGSYLTFKGNFRALEKNTRIAILQWLYRRIGMSEVLLQSLHFGSCISFLFLDIFVWLQSIEFISLCNRSLTGIGHTISWIHVSRLWI